MSNKQTCIFPETVPGDEILFPLVQVFTPLVYCRTLEKDEIPAGLQSTLARELEDAGLCRIHVPSSLGEQRERFLVLIRDLKNRRDDYAAQLKNLSLSGIGSGGRAKSESKNSIIENLLQSKRVADEKQEEQEMLLWQARLLLKLGEIFDADQLELQRDLDKISQLESGLFSELRREQGDPYAMTKTLSAATGHTDGLQRLRLKAWSRLYCLGEEAGEDSHYFVTTSRDAVELLVDEYEQLRAQSAGRFLEIVLPSAENGVFHPELLEEIRQQEIFGRLQDVLLEPARVQDEQKDDFVADDGTWAQLLDRVYPSAEYGRCRLHLYSFPDIAAKELFMATFGRDEEYQEVEKQDNGEGIVVGWLEG
jgi:hypothetical protein